MDNLNLIFNKEYYRTLKLDWGNEDADHFNEELIGAIFCHQTDFRSLPINNTSSFILNTLYPGLLIGIGAPHGAGKFAKSDSDINCGFYFDYVTGQPYIPGSSVKGVLRSSFKYRNDQVNAVEEILRADYPDITKNDVNDLETAIFDNADIFLDAVIYDGDKHGRMMGLDYITPHSSPTSNPVPIRILKVLPDVRFEFRFILSDKTINGKDIKAEQLLELFKTLLVLFGAGAKTHTGYGAFEPLPSNTSHRTIQKLSPQTHSKTIESQNPNSFQKKTSPRTKCPFCGEENYVYRKDGKTKNNYCYKCRKPLYSK